MEALRKTVNFSNRAKAMNSLFDGGERKQEEILRFLSSISSPLASFNSQFEEGGKACALLPDLTLKNHLGVHGMAPRVGGQTNPQCPPKSDSKRPASHRSSRSDGS